MDTLQKLRDAQQQLEASTQLMQKAGDKIKLLSLALSIKENEIKEIKKLNIELEKELKQAKLDIINAKTVASTEDINIKLGQLRDHIQAAAVAASEHTTNTIVNQRLALTEWQKRVINSSEQMKELREEYERTLQESDHVNEELRIKLALLEETLNEASLQLLEKTNQLLDAEEKLDILNERLNATENIEQQEYAYGLRRNSVN